MRLILHIGVHKTGSSSIQYCCARNRAFLRSHGVCWPKRTLTPHRFQHSALAARIRRGRDNFVRTYLTDAFNEARANVCGTVLLSGEGLCTLSDDDVRRLASLIPDDVTTDVIVYFRNMPSYLYSRYLQHLKTINYYVTLPRFIRRVDSMQPGAVVRTWSSVFGEDHVDVRHYESHRDHLVPHFFESLNIPMPKERPGWRNTTPHAVPAAIVNELLLDGGRLERMAVRRMYARSQFRPSISHGRTAILEDLEELIDIDVDHPKLASMSNALTQQPPADTPSPSGPSRADIAALRRDLGRLQRWLWWIELWRRFRPLRAAAGSPKDR